MSALGTMLFSFFADNFQFIIAGLAVVAGFFGWGAMKKHEGKKEARNEIGLKQAQDTVDAIRRKSARDDRYDSDTELRDRMRDAARRD